MYNDSDNIITFTVNWIIIYNPINWINLNCYCHWILPLQLFALAVFISTILLVVIGSVVVVKYYQYYHQCYNFISISLNTVRRLTHKELKMQWCVLSTVAIDALVLKPQTITIHNADQISIASGQFQKTCVNNILKYNTNVEQKSPLI